MPRYSTPAIVAFGCILLSAVPVLGQFDQYTTPGRFEPQRESLESRLEEAMSDSRWKFGRWHLDPWIGLRNVAHQDNVGEAVGADVVSDLTATFGAGLNLYRPIGGDLTFAVHVLPEYVWWQDLAERRRINGRYGAGLFGNFGRIGIQASGQLLEDARFFSREVEELLNTSETVSRLEVEVEVGRGFAVFAELESDRLEYLVERDQLLPNVALLNREEEVLRSGVRYGLESGLSLGAGIETSETTFDDTPDHPDLSNSGSAPFVNLSLDRERLYLALDVAERDLSADRGGVFVNFGETTGHAAASLRFSVPVELQLFSDRNLVYSLSPQYSYFVDSRSGVGLQLALNSSMGLRAFAEEGESEYVVLAPTAPERSDDLSAWGLTLNLKLGRASFSIGTTTSDYTSNLPQFDRKITRIVSSLSVGSGSGSPWG